MQKRVVKNNLNNFGTLHIPKEQKRASYLFKSVIFLEFPTFFKVIKILKRRYFEVMLAIYLCTGFVCNAFPGKAVGDARYIEDNGPFKGL